MSFLSGLFRRNKSKNDDEQEKTYPAGATAFFFEGSVEQGKQAEVKGSAGASAVPVAMPAGVALGPQPVEATNFTKLPGLDEQDDKGLKLDIPAMNDDLESEDEEDDKALSDLMSAFEQEDDENEGMQGLLSRVEVITAQDLLKDLRSLASGPVR